MRNAQAEVDAAAPAEHVDDLPALSDTAVNRLLHLTETQSPLTGAKGIANGLALSLVIWLAIGAIVLVAGLPA